MKILSPNLIKLTSILSDLQFHDGDSLGAKLGVTRSAIWKSVKKLEEYGIEILSVKNKGYQLKEPLLLLDQDKIKQASQNIEIEVFESIDSTNSYLKKHSDNIERKICFAEIQTNGRGRKGGNWHSPFGQNIYMSYAKSFKKDVSELNGLSLVVGIACLNAIKEIGVDFPIKLKWPNDGVYMGQKLMGNLVELQSESYSQTLAIIGIGININMLFDLSTITQEWTSLQKITGKYIDRNMLCIALIHNLNFYLEQFSKYGLKEFIQQWHQLDSLYDQKIKLNNNEFSGIAKGINENGNLLLELASGETRAFSSGEASIQKQ